MNVKSALIRKHGIFPMVNRLLLPQKKKYCLLCSPQYIRGFSLLGGEPFEPKNQKVLVGLLRKIKASYPKKEIWCYSGYLFDKEILAGKLGKPAITREMLSYIDILVDGEFHIAEKALNLRFCGSSNQRVIKVPESLRTGKIVLWQDEEDL